MWWVVRAPFVSVLLQSVPLLFFMAFLLWPGVVYFGLKRTSVSSWQRLEEISLCRPNSWKNMFMLPPVIIHWRLPIARGTVQEISTPAITSGPGPAVLKSRETSKIHKCPAGLHLVWHRVWGLPLSFAWGLPWCRVRCHLHLSPGVVMLSLPALPLLPVTLCHHSFNLQSQIFWNTESAVKDRSPHLLFFLSAVDVLRFN